MFANVDLKDHFSKALLTVERDVSILLETFSQGLREDGQMEALGFLTASLDELKSKNQKTVQELKSIFDGGKEKLHEIVRAAVPKLKEICAKEIYEEIRLSEFKTLGILNPPKNARLSVAERLKFSKEISVDLTTADFEEKEKEIKILQEKLKQISEDFLIFKNETENDFEREKTEKKNLMEKLTNLHNELENRKKLLGEKVHEIENLIAEKLKIESENQKILLEKEKNLENLTGECQKFKEAFNFESAEKNKIFKKVEKLTLANLKADGEISNLKKTLQEFQNVCEGLKNKNKNLKEEKQKLLTDVEEMKNTVNKYKKELKSKEADLEELQDDYDFKIRNLNKKVRDANFQLQSQNRNPSRFPPVQSQNFNNGFSNDSCISNIYATSTNKITKNNSASTPKKNSNQNENLKDLKVKEEDELLNTEQKVKKEEQCKQM